MPNIDPELIGELDGIADELEGAWLDMVTLDSGRVVHDDLAPNLHRYAQAGGFLQDWYVAWLLAGGRRLLDERSDVKSPVRALQRLKKIISRIDLPTLEASWERRDGEPLNEYAKVTARRVFDDVADPQHRRVTKGTVESDLKRLRLAHRQVKQLASEVVVHKSASPTVDRVTDEQVEALLDDVYEVARRWMLFLDGASLFDHRDHQDEHPADPIRLALERFDWKQLVEEHAKIERLLGPRADAYPDLKDVELRYAWPGFEDA